MAAGFADRAAAGDALGERVEPLVGTPRLVLGLPRGGVVVAARVAARLHAPLGVVVVRKIGSPGHRELAMGALAVWGPHTAVVRNQHVIEAAGVTPAGFDTACERETEAARKRVAQWEQPVPDVSGTDVVLTDDGLATGATMFAAIEVVRQAGPRRIIAAVPVGAPDELRELSHRVDALAYVLAPRPFYAVGLHYRDFGEVDDATVDRTLEEARHPLRDRD